MTGVPVRHTKFASWIDEDAWMEKMSGPRWNAVLKEEADLVKIHTGHPKVKKRISENIDLYDTLKNKSLTDIPFQNGIVQIKWQSEFFKIWWFINSPDKIHECRDVLVTVDAVYCTVDIGDGSEYFELQKWSGPYSKVPDYKFSPVGPTIAIVDETVYYLGVINKLHYYQLWKMNKLGQNKVCVYKEASNEVNLDILRLDDGRVLLSKENSQEFSYYTLPTLKQTTKYYSKEHTIDWQWKRHGFMISKQHGQKTFWKNSKKLLELPAGEILVDPYAVHSGILPCLVYIVTPTGSSYYSLSENDLTLIEEKHEKLTSIRIKGTSKDGTEVHGILTYSGKPKHLFAIGYGAYGMESHTSPVMTRWGPLVKSEWAILYTFIRGGGDHTDAWAKAGRIEGRQKTIEDFECLIRSAQKMISVNPKNTVLYGRSAGGLLMGGSLMNHPDGSLASGIYAEVPYCDELRTTTNNELPLTTLEYNEFGNPSNRLEDFLSVGLLSPADAAFSIKSPSMFFLTRTAEFDSQVFAYEPVKWVRRLRNGGGIKLCIIEPGQGHFTPPQKNIEQWAVDCALLDSWIKGDLN